MIIKEKIEEALKKVRDPEIGLDIVEIGLLRNIAIDNEGVEILMTLTSPFCPFADKLIGEVEREVGKLDGAGHVRVEITFDPPWEPSADLKEKLGI